MSRRKSSRATGSQGARSFSFIGSSYARRLHVETLEDRRMLAVFSVSNLDDAGPGSLREAISMSNTSTGPDEIDFSVTGTINIASQLPVISDHLAINGPGAELLTIDAGNGDDDLFGTGDGYRIFEMNDGIEENLLIISIQGMTLTGGDTTIGGGVFESEGGAIFSRENLTITSTIVERNATGRGLDLAFFNYRVFGGWGGGISSYRSNLTVIDSSIVNNVTGRGGDSADQSNPHEAVGGNGGGISMSQGDLTIIRSNISNNSTGRGGLNSNGPSGFAANGGHGGGLSVSAGNLVVVDSTISSNSTGAGGGHDFLLSAGDGGNGGGIYSVGGSLTVERSSVTGNSTGQEGEGSMSDGNGGDGGGIYHLFLSQDLQFATIVSSTISGNSASGYLARGGGITHERANAGPKQHHYRK